MADGKWWSQSDGTARAVYVRGLSDLAIALGRIHMVTWDEISNQRNTKELQLQFGENSLDANREAESKLSGRIEAVVSGQSLATCPML
jgi:hypothetical protein